MKRLILSASLAALGLFPLSAAQAEIPAAIATPGETLVATLHAQGAQIYECKADTAGKLAWQFREPVAALIENGRTIGRHYAGPNWELDDGSVVTAKVAGRAPGATAQDIPLLKLEVTARRGSGRLADISTVQRLNTKGGVADGSCAKAGALLSVPYSADYAFYRKTRSSQALPPAQ
jgi:opacity protein-like surface antigen